MFRTTNIKHYENVSSSSGVGRVPLGPLDVSDKCKKSTWLATQAMGVTIRDVDVTCRGSQRCAEIVIVVCEFCSGCGSRH